MTLSSSIISARADSIGTRESCASARADSIGTRESCTSVTDCHGEPAPQSPRMGAVKPAAGLKLDQDFSASGAGQAAQAAQRGGRPMRSRMESAMTGESGLARRVWSADSAGERSLVRRVTDR